MYTPAKTQKTEADIKAAIRHELGQMQQFPAGLPLALNVTFYRERPKSAPKKLQYPVTRPDLDNYLKLLLDALDKYAMPDDSQIITITAHKVFAAVGALPRIEFELMAATDKE
jgi:Holliday junction resolvase RusA-like endonuclease